MTTKTISIVHLDYSEELDAALDAAEPEPDDAEPEPDDADCGCACQVCLAGSHCEACRREAARVAAGEVPRY